MFLCDRCGYATANRKHLQRHIYRTNVCSPTITNTSIDEIRAEFMRNIENECTVACHFCDKTFRSRTGRTLHIKNKHKEESNPHEACSVNQNTLNNSGSGNNVLNNSGGGNITNTFNTTNNYNITIQPRNWGDERTDFVNTELQRNLVEKGIAGILEMLDMIYFNKDIPENNNIHLISLKGKLVIVYKHPEWEIEDLGMALDAMCTKAIHKTTVFEAADLKELERILKAQNVSNAEKRQVKGRAKSRLVKRRQEHGDPRANTAQ